VHFKPIIIPHTLLPLVQTNLTNSGECPPCPPGHFCEGGLPAPAPCPPETYSDKYGTMGGTAEVNPAGQNCTLCPAGRSCLIGSSVPRSCQPGEYSDVGSEFCYSCPPGYFCPVENVTVTQLSTLYGCPGGLYCPEGTAVVPSGPSFHCGTGHYCPTASPVVMNCPPGTYNSNATVNALSQCLECPPGYYCLEGRP